MSFFLEEYVAVFAAAKWSLPDGQELDKILNESRKTPLSP